MAWFKRIAVSAALAAAASVPAIAADYDEGYYEEDDRYERAYVVEPAYVAEPAYVVERPYTVEDVAIALQQQGFVTWDWIKFRRGLWLVDDARRVDGREFDLRLDPVTLAVIWSERD